MVIIAMDRRFIQRIEKIEARLTAALPRNPDSSWITRTFQDLGGHFSPDSTAALLDPGRDILGRGGKRWRPLLMTLICEALGGGDAALPLVPLVELPHNASLIHDDIEDNSDERRGKPAVHLIHGVDSAINGGCFLYFLPLTCIDGWDVAGELKNRVYALWGEHIRRLHLGQAMDIHWHRDVRLIPSPEEYILMCRLKTGCLARFAALLGVHAAFARFPEIWVSSANIGAPGNAARCEEALGVLGDAAEKLGVGFQILDDVKNLTTGNPGKKRGDDMVEGKKSLPILLFLRHCPDNQVMVERCFTRARAGGVGVPEVEELIRELESHHILEDAHIQGTALVNEAQGALNSYFGYPKDRSAHADGPVEILAESPSEEARSLLGGITDLLR